MVAMEGMRKHRQKMLGSATLHATHICGGPAVRRRRVVSPSNILHVHMLSWCGAWVVRERREGTLGVDAPFGTSVDVAVDLVLAKEVELRPPPPPPEKSQLGRFRTELVFKMHLLFQFMGTQLSYLPTMATIHIV